MESSSLCEKNKIELWWKTQEISFENALENSPLDMEILALKQVEKTSKRDGKNWLWNPLKILSKNGQGNPIL